MLRSSRIAAVLLLPLALALGGCLTSAMWSEGDPKEEAYNQVEYEKPKRGVPVWGKVLLTPVTLVVDIVTLPVVAFLDDPFGFLFDDDDDDEDDVYYRGERDPIPAQSPPPTPPPKPKPSDAKATQPRETGR